ncbi:MAG: LacI family DNA-binding transcriptional regulator [Candidatus Limnocylindrales bacterium]
MTNGRSRTGTATLEAVARAAGVSRATVSRVVNESPRVSPEIRMAVQAVVEELGYVPNRAARSLVTHRSDSLAVVIAQPAGQVFTDPFFPRLLRGISSTLAARDRQLILMMPESAKDEQRVGDYLIAGHVDGAMLVSLHEDDPLPARLASARVPIVMVGRPPRGSRVSYVDVDNRQGAQSAVAHLIESGRGVIATITGRLDTAPGLDRRAGYRDALLDGGRPIDPTLEANGEFTRDGATAAMAHLLEVHPAIDAVFAASDQMAAAALAALVAAGRRVPTDVAVVGFDDLEIATTTTPQLTSVRQPIEELGREMARLLLEGVDAAELVPRRVILATELVVRDSSAGVPAP